MLNGPALPLLLGACVLVALPGQAGAQPGASPVEAAVPVPRERPEEARLDWMDFERMVERPARLLRKGDLAGAEAAFETLLARQEARRGRNSLAAPDRLMAFGLALFGSEGEEPDARYRQRSLFYFRRALEAYRARLGPDHPEVALAIGTLAHAALRVAPEDPLAGLEAELADAHRIYVAAYGARDVAAARMLLHRAEVLGAPSRTRGDPAAIAAAAALLRETIPLFEAADAVEVDSRLLPGELGIARMYVLHGRIGEALAAADEAAARVKRSPDADELSCMTFLLRLQHLASFMAARGYRSESEAMLRRIEPESGCVLMDMLPGPLQEVRAERWGL